MKSESEDYEVLLSPHAKRDLNSIKDFSSYNTIVEALEGLSVDPRPQGIRKLESGIYRIRVGGYRIIYIVKDKAKVVIVSHIRKRTEHTYQ